jgi:hypothetical protein
MSTERIELRASAMHDVGIRLDDLLEAARKEVLRCEGAVTGILQCAKAVNDLIPHVDKDVDEGKYDLETAKLIKLYLSRAAYVVQNLGMNASNQRIASAGQVQMAEVVVTVTKKMYDAEMQRSAAMAASASEGNTNPRERVVGSHPPATIKEQRRAEEQAEVAAKEAVAVPPMVKVRKKPGPKPKDRTRVENA